MTYVQRFEALLAEAEKEAYARGWREAIEAMTRAATTLTAAPGQTSVNSGRGAEKPTITPAQPKSPRGRRPTAVAAILETINEHPGLRGHEIISYLEAKGIQSNDRTVRSALRRLKGTHIWQRSQKWYPKHGRDSGGNSQVDSEAEKEFGEVSGSPPH